MKDKLYSESEIMTKLSYTKPYFGEDSTKERYRYMQWLADTNAIKELKPARAIFIPDGATNGDIIKAIFPDMYSEECDYDIFTDLDGDTRFTYDWWRAPYKSEGEG